MKSMILRPCLRVCSSLSRDKFEIMHSTHPMSPIMQSIEDFYIVVMLLSSRVCLIKYITIPQGREDRLPQFDKICVLVNFSF